MKFKTIDNVSLKGKRVLLRVDINSPLINNKIVDNERIEIASKTINDSPRPIQHSPASKSSFYPLHLFCYY